MKYFTEEDYQEQINAIAKRKIESKKYKVDSFNRDINALMQIQGKTDETFTDLASLYRQRQEAHRRIYELRIQLLKAKKREASEEISRTSSKKASKLSKIIYSALIDIEQLEKQKLQQEVEDINCEITALSQVQQKTEQIWGQLVYSHTRLAEHQIIQATANYASAISILDNHIRGRGTESRERERLSLTSSKLKKLHEEVRQIVQEQAEQTAKSVNNMKRHLANDSPIASKKPKEDLENPVQPNLSFNISQAGNSVPPLELITSATISGVTEAGSAEEELPYSKEEIPRQDAEEDKVELSM